MNHTYSPEIFDPSADLLERRRVLEQAQNIGDMRTYAASWLCLARTFRACGLRNNYEYCKSRGRHYARLAREIGGEYVRLFELPFAEIIAVS